MKKRPIFEARLRGFEPKTGMDAKEELRDALRKEIEGRPSLQCTGKLLLRARFYLYGGGDQNSRFNKDLDNMLKVLLDVLPEYMDQQRKKRGLGIITDDGCIYRIEADKQIVQTGSEEGMKISIFRHGE